MLQLKNLAIEKTKMKNLRKICVAQDLCRPSKDQQRRQRQVHSAAEGGSCQPTILQRDDKLTDTHQTQQAEPNYRVLLPERALMNDPYIEVLPASVWVYIFSWKNSARQCTPCELPVRLMCCQTVKSGRRRKIRKKNGWKEHVSPGKWMCLCGRLGRRGAKCGNPSPLATLALAN